MLPRVFVDPISFNDNSNYFISDLAGLEMPQTRVVSYDLAGEHFGIFVSAFYGKRIFSLRGWVVGSDPTDFIQKRDAFQSAFDILAGEKTIIFTLSNNRMLQINAVITALSFVPEEGYTNAAQFNAQFQSAFPFLTSTAEYSPVTNLAAGGGGKLPPDTMPMSLAPDSGGKIFATNSGNAISYPIAKMFGPVVNPSLRNSTTQKQLRCSLTLSAGEYLELNFKNKTITDNTGRNRYDTKVGDWWYLQPGINEVRFLADAYNAQASAQLFYCDSYLGI